LAGVLEQRDDFASQVPTIVVTLHQTQDMLTFLPVDDATGCSTHKCPPWAMDPLAA
jgi:hypothetical protein